MAPFDASSLPTVLTDSRNIDGLPVRKKAAGKDFIAAMVGKLTLHFRTAKRLTWIRMSLCGAMPSERVCHVRRCEPEKTCSAGAMTNCRRFRPTPPWSAHSSDADLSPIFLTYEQYRSVAACRYPKQPAPYVRDKL